MKALTIFRLSLFLVMLSLTVTVAAKKDSQYLLTEKTYKVLTAAQDLMVTEQYDEAERKLKTLLTTAKPYDKAVAQQTLGYLYSSQEKYKQARSFFQLALDSGALPEKVSHHLKYNLAQLFIAEDKYKQGILLLEDWLKSEVSPPDSAYILLASAYYRIKSYKQTITHIHTVIKSSSSAKESWYQLLLSSHLELQQYKSAIKTLETLITLYPYKKTYWTQLSALYLYQNKEFTALAIKSLIQRLELDDSKTLINLADMYRYLHIPYKSAQLLTNGLSREIIEADSDNLNRLADSWLAAKEAEKAVSVLQQLAVLDDSGESDLKYGRVLFGLEQWQQAIAPLSNSLKKLKGEKIGKAALLLGMAQFHTGKLLKAKLMFTKAVVFDNERNQADQWLRHVEKQLEDEVINAS